MTEVHNVGDIWSCVLLGSPFVIKADATPYVTFEALRQDRDMDMYRARDIVMDCLKLKSIKDLDRSM